MDDLLRLRLSAARVETAIRWIAMGIAATPEHLRMPKYASARESIAEVIERYGIGRAEGEACVRRNMEALFGLVRELEIRRGSKVGAKAA